MKNELIDRKRKILDEKYRRQIKRLEREGELISLLPGLIDERFIPRIHVISNTLSERLGYSASLHFGKNHWGRKDDPYVTDTEVSILMKQYVPVPMVYRDIGTIAFRPTTKELWDSYWKDNIVEEPNGLTSEYKPLSPFVFCMETAPYGSSTFVKWFTELGPYTVSCVAHLDPDKDPSYFYRTRKGGPRSKIIIRDVVPQLAGTYSQYRIWTADRETNASVIFYWDWPDPEFMKWGNVIDFTPRNEARE